MISFKRLASEWFAKWSSFPISLQISNYRFDPSTIQSHGRYIYFWFPSIGLILKFHNARSNGSQSVHVTDTQTDISWIWTRFFIVPGVLGVPCALSIPVWLHIPGAGGWLLGGGGGSGMMGLQTLWVSCPVLVTSGG